MGGAIRRVVGVCGGYQILGERLDDPLGMEGEPGGQAEGLGLLPVTTRFSAQKETHQANMRLDDGEAVRGYEIHTGDTRIRAGTAPFGEIIERNGRPVSIPDGAAAEDGSVWGSYVHGLFENDGFRHRWLRGLGYSVGRGGGDQGAEYEQQYDGLTPEGGEMEARTGRQAEAAGIYAHTDMNPVLLMTRRSQACSTPD